jgi:ankyrin repeat protein
VGGRPVAIYLLALTTLTMPTMPNIYSNTYILTLSTGADISIENESGWTSLQLAALNSHYVVKQLLVIRGAPEPEDFYGLQKLFS